MFGAQQQPAPAQGTTLFGSAPTTQPTLTLFGTGTPAGTSSGLFGTAPSSTASAAPGGFTFAQPTATSVGFGSSATTAAVQPTFGVSTSAPSGATGLTFPSTTQAAATATAGTTGGFTFPSTAAATTAQPASTGFTFPSATATSTAQPQGTGSTLFGTTQATPAATTTGLTFTAQPTTSQPTSTAPSFGFGTATPASSGPGLGSTGFTFGATTTTAAPTAAIAATPAATTLGGTATPFKLSFGATPSAPTTAPQALAIGSAGLGGLQPAVSSDPSQVLATGGGTVGGAMTSVERTLQDAPLPDELVQLVEELRNHIFAETSTLAEVTSTAGRAIGKVSDTCDTVRQHLGKADNMIHRQILDCETLHAQAQKDMKDAEMALAVLRTPPALQQHAQRGPHNYLFNTLVGFQEKITMYKREIAKAETVLRTRDGPKQFARADLSLALQSTKDSMVVMAARVKALHERIASETEAHRNILRFAKGSKVSRGVPAGRAQQRYTGPPSAYGSDKTIDAYRARANVLFSPRYPKSPHNADILNSSSPAPRPSWPSPAQRLFHSTQLPSQMANSTFNTSGFGQSLFQNTSAASPIFASDMPSPVGGASLKRSKH